MTQLLTYDDLRELWTSLFHAAENVIVQWEEHRFQHGPPYEGLDALHKCLETQRDFVRNTVSPPRPPGPLIW